MQTHCLCVLGRFRLLANIVLIIVMLHLIIPGNANCSSISDLYASVNNTVVVIHTAERGRLKSRPEVESTEIGLGSGVVISNDGLILTAAHVINLADAVEVKFMDGAIMDAKILGVVNWADVGLLKLERAPDHLAVADIGDSDAVKVGDNIFIIGAPRNLDHTLTVGYISGKRTSQYGLSPITPEFFQTDAAINEGNSGGPMFDQDGKLIAIVSQFISLSGGSEGLGLSIAINVAKELLLNQSPYWFGAELNPLGPKLAAALNVAQQKGFLVQRVAKNSPAAASGLRQGTIRIVKSDGPLLIGGDIILSVDHKTVPDKVVDLEEILRKKPIGHRMRFELLRDGAVIPLFIKR